MAGEFDIKGDGKWIVDGDGKWKIDNCCCPCPSETCCGCCCQSTGLIMTLSIPGGLCSACDHPDHDGSGVAYPYSEGAISLEKSLGTHSCPNVSWDGNGSLRDSESVLRWVTGVILWNDSTNCWSLAIGCLYNYPSIALTASMFHGFKGGGTPCGTYYCDGYPDDCTEGGGPEDCRQAHGVTVVVSGCPTSGACGEEGCNCYPAWTATNCNCSAEYPCAPCDTASSYAITGYSSTFFTVSGCTSCSTSTESEWNGSFLKASVLWPSEEGYFDQGSATGAVRINGKTHLLTTLVNGGSVCTWTVTVKCDDQVIWIGSKDNRDEPTPVGTYTRSGGCDTTGTITLE